MPLYCLVGIGDIRPLSFLGRLSGIILCLMGTVLFSQLISDILLTMSLSTENEKKAYAQIRFLLRKKKLTTISNLYFNSFISYKIRKIRNDFHQTDPIAIFKKKNSLNILKEKYALRIRASLKVPITFKDFNKFINEHWTSPMKQINEQIKERVDFIKPYNDYICDTIPQYRNDVFSCVFACNQLINVISLIYWCGNAIKIDNNMTIAKNGIVQSSQFEIKMKEFFMKYKDRLMKNIINRRDSLFHTGNGIKSSNYYSEDNEYDNDDSNDNDYSSFDNEYNDSLDLFVSNSHIDENNSH